MGMWSIESQCNNVLLMHSSIRLKYCSRKFFPNLANNQNHLGSVKTYKFPGPILKGGIQEPVEAASGKATVYDLTLFKMSR